MAGPWEKYKAPAADGPWSKFGGGSAASPAEESDGPEVLNEAHPDVSLGSRLMFKNFGADQDAGVKYLSRENPGLEFKKENRDIIVRKPGDAQWRRLDPSGLSLTSFEGIKEAGRDLGDVAFDVPAAIGQGALTAAAGVGAGAATGGTAAIPAAMATSGASGAGIEAVRQGIGKYFGVNEEMDPTQIGISGALGTVSPLLLGTGATAAQVGKSAVQKGLSGDALKALSDSQRGVIGRSYDATAGYVGPKAAAFASGIKEKVIRALPENLAKIKASEANPEVVAQTFEPVMQSFSKAAKNEYQQVGKLMGEAKDAMESSGARIDVSDIGSSLKSLQDEIKVLGSGTEVDKAAANELEGILPSLFSRKKEVEKLVLDPDTMQMKMVKETIMEPITDLSPKEALLKKQQVEELARQYGSRLDAAGAANGTTGSIKSTMDKRIAGSLNQLAADLDGRVMSSVPEEIGASYGALKDAYSAAKTTAEDFNKYSDKTEAFGRLLNRAQQNPYDEALLTKVAKSSGTDVDKLVDQAGAFKLFRKPSIDAVSGAATSTSKTVPLSNAMGTLGYGVGQASGGMISPFLAASAGQAAGRFAGAPATIRKFYEMNQRMRTLPASTSAVQTAVPFWTKMAQEENK